MAGGLIEYILQVRDQASGPLDQAGQSAQGAADDLDRTSQAAQGLEENAGEASSVASGLAGALGTVSPEAEELATIIADLSGGVEALARGSGSLLAILGPVAVAVGALTAAYVLLRREQQRLIDLSNTRISQMKEEEALIREENALRLEAAFARGEITEAELQMAQATAEGGDRFREQTEGIRANISALERMQRTLQQYEQQGKEVSATQEAIKDGLATMSLGATKLGDELAQATIGWSGIDAAAGLAAEHLPTGEFEGFLDQVKQSESVTDDFRESLESLGAGEGTVSEQLARVNSLLAVQRARLGITVERTEKWVEARKDVIQQPYAAAVEAETVKIEEQEKALQDTQKALDQLIALQDKLTQDTLSDEDKINKTLQERLDLIWSIADANAENAEIQRQARIAEREAMERAQRDMEALLQTTKEMADEQVSMVERMGQVTSGVQGGISGGVAGVASQMGPIGAIIGAILGIVQSIGEQGGQAFADSIGDLNDNLIAGIEALPDLLAEKLPEVGNEFLSNLTTTILEQTPQIVAGIVEGTFNAIEFLLIELPGVLIAALVQVVQDIGSGFGEGEGRGAGWRAALAAGTGLTSEFIIRALGRNRGEQYVSEDGWRYLHRGNQVVQRGAAPTQSAESGGDGMNIVINTNAVSPDFMSWLSDRITEAKERGLVF